MKKEKLGIDLIAGTILGFLSWIIFPWFFSIGAIILGIISKSKYKFIPISLGGVGLLFWILGRLFFKFLIF